MIIYIMLQIKFGKMLKDIIIKNIITNINVIYNFSILNYKRSDLFSDLL